MLRIYRRGGTPEEADLSIKRFIQNTNQAYRCKRFRSGEFFPLLYGERFKEITQRFLIRIIEMNTYTQVYMKHREFPHAAWEDGDSTWDECSFAMGQGKGRYIHYQFARMTDDQFHEAVSEYLNDFFSIIRGGKILVFDQLLRRDDLELINSYMDIPIKQICVFRDPRDSYLSALRMDVHEQPATVSDFKTYHMNRRNEFSPDYPHRLIIRFEDLVLKYDETCQKIMEFLHLNVEEHIAKKSVFDPQLSVQNIGAYKHYLRPELMREIETEMPECCYVPTKENLSRDSLMLLKTSGNWDDIL